MPRVRHQSHASAKRRYLVKNCNLGFNNDLPAVVATAQLMTPTSAKFPAEHKEQVPKRFHWFSLTPKHSGDYQGRSESNDRSNKPSTRSKFAQLQNSKFLSSVEIDAAQQKAQRLYSSVGRHSKGLQTSKGVHHPLIDTSSRILVENSNESMENTSKAYSSIGRQLRIGKSVSQVNIGTVVPNSCSSPNSNTNPKSETQTNFAMLGTRSAKNALHGNFAIPTSSKNANRPSLALSGTKTAEGKPPLAVKNNYYTYNYSIEASSAKLKVGNVLLSSLVQKRQASGERRLPFIERFKKKANKAQDSRKRRSVPRPRSPKNSYADMKESEGKVELKPNEYQDPKIKKRLERIHRSIERLKKVRTASQPFEFIPNGL